MMSAFLTSDTQHKCVNRWKRRHSLAVSHQSSDVRLSVASVKAAPACGGEVGQEDRKAKKDRRTPERIMAAPLGRDSLPEHWSYGVCGDGRVFFINDQTRETSWLHPRSSEPVNSGHMIRSDLPQGWEEGFTNDGACYFINHNQRTTTFCHPVSGHVSPDNVDVFHLKEQRQSSRMMSQPGGEHLSSTVSEDSTTITTSSTVDVTSTAKGSRSSRVHNFGKREQAIKRNPNVPVVVRGWLYKQDSSGMRLWKRKWFVLADFCLFYYKDSREEAVLGSIPLPSYVISPVGAEDHISRKYAFKAEHTGMRTYYFSADTQEDMTTWLRAMNQAAHMQNPARPSDTLEHFNVTQQQMVSQTNHVNHHRAPDGPRPVVHEVLLEPIHHEADYSFQRDSPAAAAAAEMDTHTSLPSHAAASAFSQPDQSSSSAPVSRVSSRAPSRAASTLPPGVCTRNGLVETPSPILEPNGIAAGTYQRAAANPEGNGHKEVRRRSTLEQVEHWVQVQKAELKGPPSRDNTLPRRTPPSQPKFSTLDAYQTLPKTPRPSPPPARLGEYKYAHDRLSHFRLTPELSGPGSNTTLQLYEWQQRQQYRHGSPTAPLYTPAPDYPYGARPPSAAKHNGSPRCVSVPPSPADMQPPGTSRTLSPARRPHTPADRVTVRPLGDASMVDTPFTVSPRRTKSQLFKASTIERRSLPPSNYITHTVSAPSLHGKTTDDTYMQLRKDLEYLDLKVAGKQTLTDRGQPVKVAESDVDVKLSRLCEQDKILKDLEVRISALKQDKDKLESVLDVSHQQMELYQEQPAHFHKIAYQQRLLQEDLVSIRAQISRLSTEMTHAWEDYGWLESSVEQLRAALQAHMSHSATPHQEKAEMKRELWRIEDVMAGLSGSKANYKVTVNSVHNPDRKLVPSVSEPSVPSYSADLHLPPRSSLPPVLSHTLPHKWAEDGAPPRPPLPHLYDYEDTPPEVPPLPREASVIRHTSVRGLKRQSDERKRDREGGQYVVNGDFKGDLRSFLSEPELPGIGHADTDDHYLDTQGISSSTTSSRPYLDSSHSYGSFADGAARLSGPSWRLNHSDAVSSFVTLRRGPASSVDRERPRSALECLSSDVVHHSGGRMSADEQLERMKRHQRALVRDRKRNLSPGERSSASVPARRAPSSFSPWPPSGTSDPPASSVFDWREERQVAEGQSDEGARERGSVKAATLVRETDVEPLDFHLDISKELCKPQKVSIPERYVESDPEEPLSPEEKEERRRRAQRIKELLSKSNVQNLQSAPLDLTELDSVLRQQERIMNASRALASEASQKSKLVAAQAAAAAVSDTAT
ncbi:pleckstrin homology domain-containing family A member 7-like isoform X2 [Entelurus aequoreus]|uniref:pleckstrin homology domain-containing family A member 7-like isoform X2 n=1 Tax=Entelurus aequoreus TaxID=161455 RepID=UPI002B1CEB7F|nr:pleckstrin homology domain-containing family A member 7-like isoform X2 [Entelurus aequoreus]